MPVDLNDHAVAWAALDDLVDDLTVTALEFSRFGTYFMCTIRRNAPGYVYQGTGSTLIDAFREARRIYREEHTHD